MLSGEGNAGEWWKITIGLMSKKSNFALAAHFFCAFLCRCFARLQRETSRNFYVFSCTFFSLPLIFTLYWWPLAFPILSPPPHNFHVALLIKFTQGRTVFCWKCSWKHRQPKRTMCGFGLQRSSGRNILELLLYYLQARIQGRWNGWIFTSLFLSPSSIMLMYRPQTPQPGFGSITL